LTNTNSDFGGRIASRSSRVRSRRLRGSPLFLRFFKERHQQVGQLVGMCLFHRHDHRRSHPQRRRLSGAKRAGRGRLLCCMPRHPAHLSHAPSSRPTLIPARTPCLVVRRPGLVTSVRAAHAAPHLAATAAPGAGQSARPAGEPAGLRTSEHLRLPSAAAVRAGPVERLAGLKMAGRNRVGPAAGICLPAGLPACPAE